MSARQGGRILVDQLLIHGVTDVFCVPGESYLAVLDALHDADCRVTVCRQESGAAIMAEAVGKLTGQPGIVMVTRGPGATNASAGLHIAAQDSTPLILFVGQVATDMKEREAFQELDYRAVFGSIAKWVVEIDRIERIPELVSRAFHVAVQGRPGPVVVALPEDMLSGHAEVADAVPYRPARAYPAPDDLIELKARLEAAARPILVVGGSGWSEAAVEGIAAFAERFHLPVATSFRRQALFSTEHPNFAGDLGIGPNPKLLARIKEADLILLVGGRLSEMPSQSYTVLDIPGSGERLIHVHPGPEELNRVYRAGLAIAAGPIAFAAAVGALAPDGPLAWTGAAEAAHRDYLAWSDSAASTIPGALQMGAVMAHLNEALPADAIVCNGAGNYNAWVHRYYRFRHFGTQLGPVSGSMGYGVPAAVAAKRTRPDRTVVAFAGDGCFLMTGQEFATAVQYKLPIVILVINNGMYGTIRMHQEREYPGRISATRLVNPDFAAYARAFGGHGETVARTEDFAPALDRAFASGKPAILHCLLDPEAITPATTLQAITAKARAAQGGAPS